MFKSFLNLLDKVPEDELTERIERDTAGRKYYFYFGGAIICILAATVLSITSILKFRSPPPPVVYMINVETLQTERIVTLPFPHQSIKNIQSWLTEAIMAAYSFSFLNFNDRVAAAEIFFTPEGYIAYLNSLKLNGIEAAVVGENIVISSVPMSVPILINAGMIGDTAFWRFRVPILVSYMGGAKEITREFMVETLVLRVPAYQNHRSLGIAEFNMVPQ